MNKEQQQAIKRWISELEERSQILSEYSPHFLSPEERKLAKDEGEGKKKLAQLLRKTLHSNTED